MTRFGLAALAMIALGACMATAGPAAAWAGVHEAPGVMAVQYRAYERPYYRPGAYYRGERRAERRAWRRERERRVARQAYRAGRRDAYYGRRF